MLFYSSGRFAHELALLQDAGYRNSRREGLVHLCFNVADKSNLQTLYQRCQSMGITTSNCVDHIIMHSFYTRDPDDHVIEIGTDRPESEWRKNPQAFTEDRAGPDLKPDGNKH